MFFASFILFCRAAQILLNILALPSHIINPSLHPGISQLWCRNWITNYHSQYYLKFCGIREQLLIFTWWEAIIVTISCSCCDGWQSSRYRCTSQAGWKWQYLAVITPWWGSSGWNHQAIKTKRFSCTKELTVITRIVQEVSAQYFLHYYPCFQPRRTSLLQLNSFGRLNEVRITGLSYRRNSSFLCVVIVKCRDRLPSLSWAGPLPSPSVGNPYLSGDGDKSRRALGDLLLPLPVRCSL